MPTEAQEVEILEAANLNTEDVLRCLAVQCILCVDMKMPLNGGVSKSCQAAYDGKSAAIRFRTSGIPVASLEQYQAMEKAAEEQAIEPLRKKIPESCPREYSG